MTEKEVRAKLYRVRDLIAEEQRIREQMQKLKDRQLSITQQLSDMPRGGTPFTTLDYVIGMEELYNMFTDTLAKEMQAYKEALLMINTLNGWEREALVRYYLMFETWEQVAVHIGKGVRWTMTLHKRAIKKLAKAC